MKDFMGHYVYMLRCQDDSLYTGYATNVFARMKEHFSGSARSSRYVRSRGAKKLEVYWWLDTKELALKLEYRIKQLTKAQKEELVEDPTKINLYIPESEKYLSNQDRG